MKKNLLYMDYNTDTETMTENHSLDSYAIFYIRS